MSAAVSAPLCAPPRAQRILVTGASGQLGTELARVLPALGTVVATTRATLDLREPEQIRLALRAVAPSIVVNAAAYTAVDAAEANVREAVAVNAEAPAVLAEECARANVVLVHVSTDYVFDGALRRPYREDDATAPLNVYGATKRDGECAVLAARARALIVRTGWLYGPSGRNFLNTMLRLAATSDVVRVVDDQHGTPTSTSFLADAIATILADAQLRTADPHDPVWGMYHVSPAGATTWHGLAAAIFREAERRGTRVPPLVPIATSDYPTAARRPTYSVLDSSKAARTFGIAAPAWTELLRAAMAVRMCAVSA